MSAKLNFCPTCGKTLAWADDVGGFCATCGYVGGYAQGAAERTPAAQGAPAPQPAAPQQESPYAANLRMPFEPVVTSADVCPRFFNWGALLLPFVWSIGNQIWVWAAVMGGIWLVGVILSMVSFVGMMTSFSHSGPNGIPNFGFIGVQWFYGVLQFLAYFGISIYLGVDGNRLAWKARGFTSAAAFRKEQGVWTIVGLIVVGAMLLLLVLYAFFVFAFASQAMHGFPGAPK